MGSGNDLWIGRDPSNAGRRFHGQIDEVEIFNRALGDEEIAAIYNAGSAGKCKDLNQSPSADAGGSYSVGEGSSIALDGTGSSDPDGSIVAYEWDFDYDGNSFQVDATGATPTFSAAALDGPASRVLALRVTDDEGATSEIAAAALSVTNVAPTAGITGPAGGLKDQTLSFTLGATDPSNADQSAPFTYGIDWNGDGVVDETIGGLNGLEVNHVFGADGRR